MIRIKKAHHTSFGVADLNQSKDFYGRILGLETIDRPLFRFDGAWYGIGPYQIHLMELDKSASQAKVPPRTRTEVPQSRATHLALEVEDVAPLKERLEQEGIPFREGEIVLTNMRQIFCWDPDGNGIEFISLKK